SNAPVEVLEVKKVSRIEAARGVDRLAPNEHEAATHHRHGRGDLLAARRVHDVAHFVTLQALAEQTPQRRGRESPQREIEHAGIALAHVFARAVIREYGRRDGADAWMRLEIAQRHR